MSGKIKVFIIDDSAVIRQVLTSVLDNSPDIEVVGKSQNPVDAMRKMEQQWPDVIILDIEMPKMDGITFLKKIMKERPTAVIMCSTLTKERAPQTMDAFAAGAIDAIEKPKVGLQEFLTAEAAKFISAIKSAAQCNITAHKNLASAVKSRKIDTDDNSRNTNKLHETSRSATSTEKIVAIGSSTGGTTALDLTLEKLDLSCCGVVITQHMPPKFTMEFARRLDDKYPIHVSEAKDDERILTGHVYIAPGDLHLQIKNSGGKYYTMLNDAPPINRHKPSVDVLFKSVAANAGRNALGVILTGMGKDGAQGLKEIQRAGGDTIAQDQKTSAIFGMPAAAIELNAANHILPLMEIGNRIQFFSEQRKNINKDRRSL